jgi:hypothetical protein
MEKVYEIDKSMIDVILENKEKMSLLSYPARRVIYAGRVTGKWYTKSKSVYQEILDLHGVLKSVYGKGKSENKKENKKGVANKTAATPTQAKEVIDKLDHLLKILTSYQERK